MISSMCLYINIKRIPTQQLWIAHQYKQTILVSLANQKLTFHVLDSLSQQANLVADFRNLYSHQKIDFQPLVNAYHINGNSLLLIDGPWVMDPRRDSRRTLDITKECKGKSGTFTPKGEAKKNHYRRQ